VSPRARLRVRLLGQPRLEGPDGQPRQPPRGQKSWAVLARIALADRPITRSALADELFCDAADPLGALRWALADLRRCCQDPELLRGDPLRVTTDQLWIDVRDLWAGRLSAAEIGGELLASIQLRNCPAFDMWLMLVRGRCAARSREELRHVVLSLLSAGEMEAAAETAGRAAAADPLDEGAQELFLRTLMAAGHPARAAVHLAACEATFARNALVPSAALRAAARPAAVPAPAGLRASVVADALLRAGAAALDAGSADAGVETLRQAAEAADRSADHGLQASVLLALGAALVHAIRGFDGEGTLVLHRALVAARTAASPGLTADILRELAFADVQAGRHASAARALREAAVHARAAADPALVAKVLAIRGMNEADQGRHDAAAALLENSAVTAAGSGDRRQEAWSMGLLARSLLLAGQLPAALAAAERSIEICDRDRWNAFLPWSQAIRAHCLAAGESWAAARADAEHAFALACQLGDPCWEGMAGRALALLAKHDGDDGAADEWIGDARRRSDRVPDRYVWVSGFVALGELEIAAGDRDRVLRLARRLYKDAVRHDLPEFIAWAVIHQAESGDRRNLALARSLASQITNPAVRRRAAALGG
jgi:DNA-binding SARP family transcriptional activator